MKNRLAPRGERRLSPEVDFPNGQRGESPTQPKKSAEELEQTTPGNDRNKTQPGGNQQQDNDDEREVLKGKHRYSPCGLY
jgi:hypothetical protein